MNGDVCVIIPVHGAMDVVAPQLQALASQQGAPDFTVVLADNGKNGDLLALAAQSAPDLRVQVVDATDEPGTAFARNMGMAAAEGDKLLFCDADDLVGPTWVRDGAATLDEVPIFSGGAVPFTSEELDRPLGEVWDELERRLPAYLNDTRDAVLGDYPVLLGCSFGITRSFARHLGGFDRGFGSQAEDNDLAFRAQAAYGTLPRAAYVAIAYRVRSSDEGSMRRSFRAGYNHAVMCARHDAWKLSPSFKGRWLARPMKEALTGRGIVGSRSDTFGRLGGQLVGRARYSLLPLPPQRTGINRDGADRRVNFRPVGSRRSKAPE